MKNNLLQCIIGFYRIFPVARARFGVFAMVVTTSFHLTISLFQRLQVLLVTGMRRSESLLEPELFHYHDHFEFCSLIGETKTSEVFRVKHRQTGEIFAVKRSRKRFRSKMQRERCLREIQAVAALPEHDNIVAQYRAWQEGGHFYIQMDYCDGGSLQQYLQSGNQAPILREDEIWKVALDVSDGLQFLHGNNVLHLDIKPDNLYRKKEKNGSFGCWKIGDFGLAVGKEATDWEEGDGDYVAPELLKSGTEPSPSADIFSLGATLYECLTGEKLPRKDGTPDADLSYMDKTTDLQILLHAMIQSDPHQRPTASQVMAYSKEKISQLKNRKSSRKGLPSLLPDHPQERKDALDLGEHLSLDGIKTKGEVDSKFRLPMLKIPKGSGSASNATTGRTTDASNSFRIMRRDLSSPGRDGASDTTGSVSEMELPDLISPRSQKDGGLFGPLSSRLLRGAGTLAFDLNTSPDVALSNQTSPIRGKSQGKSQGRLNLTNDEPEDFFKTSSAPSTARSSSGVNKITVWNEFSDISVEDKKITCAKTPSSYKSPFESHLTDTTNRVRVPSLNIKGNNFGKKRQHSSRKLSVSNRDTGRASNRLNSSRSVENCMPHKKGARYSVPSSGCIDVENIVPIQGQKPPHCPVSTAMNGMKIE